MAFHPDYPQNAARLRRTTPTGTATPASSSSPSKRASRATGPASYSRSRQPYANHNGGQVAFGPDGKLYVGMGDGGSGGDPENRAQNLDTRSASCFGIDVDAPAPRWELVAYGVRNPWRFSFDRRKGDLWIGDVGQNAWEEINFYAAARAAASTSAGTCGRGRIPSRTSRFTPGGRVVGPVFEYSHSQGCSVTGGFVYRGRAFPALRGTLLRRRLLLGTVWSMRSANGRRVGLRREPFTLPQLTSFGEDATGELYLLSDDGSVSRLAGACLPLPFPATVPSSALEIRATSVLGRSARTTVTSSQRARSSAARAEPVSSAWRSTRSRSRAGLVAARAGSRSRAGRSAGAAGRRAGRRRTPRRRTSRRRGWGRSRRGRRPFRRSCTRRRGRRRPRRRRSRPTCAPRTARPPRPAQ